eukprot:jgi/Mesvir1/13738/Mv11883-RA.1
MSSPEDTIDGDGVGSSGSEASITSQDFAAAFDEQLKESDDDGNDEESEEALWAEADDGRAAKRQSLRPEFTPGDSIGKKATSAAAAATFPAGGTCPPHPGYAWDMCIRCGAHKPVGVESGREFHARANLMSPLPDDDGDDDSDEGTGSLGVGSTGVGGSGRRSTAFSQKPLVQLHYMGAQLELSQSEAARVAAEETARVLSARKLRLVLDLDHTLLNSLAEREVGKKGGVGEKLGEKLEAAMAHDVGAGLGLLHRVTALATWSKLRPYVREFLAAVSQWYELWVYTMGERAYAEGMARLLDPSGRLFGRRIISQQDSTQRDTKNLDVVMSDPRSVVILDDTPAVWPGHSGNLVVVERYHYFPAPRMFGHETPSLLERGRDESAEKGVLASLVPILRKVHAAFFDDGADAGASTGGATPGASSDTRAGASSSSTVGGASSAKNKASGSAAPGLKAVVATATVRRRAVVSSKSRTTSVTTEACAVNGSGTAADAATNGAVSHRDVRQVSASGSTLRHGRETAIWYYWVELGNG